VFGRGLAGLGGLEEALLAEQLQGPCWPGSLEEASLVWVCNPGCAARGVQPVAYGVTDDGTVWSPHGSVAG